MDARDSVCVFGFNSPQWIMAALGATLAGGCCAGIYPTDTPEQVEYKAKHSAAVGKKFSIINFETIKCFLLVKIVF